MESVTTEAIISMAVGYIIKEIFSLFRERQKQEEMIDELSEIMNQEMDHEVRKALYNKILKKHL